MSFGLCDQCYDQYGGQNILRAQSSSSGSALPEMALALPPLTMLGNDNTSENAFQVREDQLAYNFSRMSLHREMTESCAGMLPYLSLKERKPYPNHVVFDQDPMGAKVVDKVSDAKRIGNLLKIISLFICD